MRPLRFWVPLFAGLLMAGCASVPLYQAPGATSPHASLVAVNRLGAGDPRFPNRVALFEVDGVHLAERAGTRSARVAPGEHRIKLFADHNGILQFVTLRHRFAAGATYSFTVTPGQDGDRYRVTLTRDGDAAPLKHVDF